MQIFKDAINNPNILGTLLIDVLDCNSNHTLAPLARDDESVSLSLTSGRLNYVSLYWYILDILHKAFFIIQDHKRYNWEKKILFQGFAQFNKVPIWFLYKILIAGFS